MKHIILGSLSALLLFSCVAQPVVFAAYGGGGGGSSLPMSSLQRDVCSGGDKSISYYDGSCEQKIVSSEKVILVKEEKTQEHAVADVQDVVTKEELRELADKKELKKQEIKKIEKKLTAIQRLKVDMIEKKVDSLLNRWAGMNDEKKLKKAVLLETRVSMFLSVNKNIPPLLASIATYIQQMALDMIIDIQTDRIKVLSVTSA